MRSRTRGRADPGDEMNFEYLDEFVHLARSLSFRRTAEHFFVSRSVISRHMAALEESLGALLFVRDTHGVELTDAGEVFLQEARSLLRGWELAQERVRSVSGTGDKLVRIGYLRNGARPFLVRFVNSMAKEHPSIRLSLLCMKYGELRQALEEHGVDVAIGMNVDSSISSDYRSTPIYRDHFVIACNRANPLASMASGITVDDLRDQRLLIPDSYMSSGLAEGIRPFVDDETLAEAEELYMDMDLLYLKLRTENCIAFVSDMNASMFDGRFRSFPYVTWTSASTSVPSTTTSSRATSTRHAVEHSRIAVARWQTRSTCHCIGHRSNPDRFPALSFDARRTMRQNRRPRGPGR